MFAGEKVSSIRLRERYNQRPHVPDKKDQYRTFGKYDYIPNGMLVLDSGPSYSNFSYCQDTQKKRRFEDSIDYLIIDFIEEAGRIRIHRRREEEECRRREEKERIRREQEEELRRRRKELQQKQGAEQRRVDGLINEATSWKQSLIIRDYIQLVQKTAIDRHGKIEEGSEPDRWIIWATQQADRLDPLVESPASILDDQI